MARGLTFITLIFISTNLWTHVKWFVEKKSLPHVTLAWYDSYSWIIAGAFLYILIAFKANKYSRLLSHSSRFFSPWANQLRMANSLRNDRNTLFL